MKKLLCLTVAGCLGLLPATAQEGFIPLEKWDHTAYCSYTELHPMQAVRADNNWQLLWTLRKPGTSADVAAQGIPCTVSQLMLLKTQRLLERTDEELLKTAVPILDSLTTIRLRSAAQATAEAMTDNLKPAFRSFAAELDKEGFGKNAFSILFSYILDGTIWNEFERRKIVGEMDDTETWSGTLWFYYPRSTAFRPGTNTLSWDDRHTLHVNWADGDPAFVKRIYHDDALRFFQQTIAGGKVDDRASAIGRELGLCDGTRMTVPVIRTKGPLARKVRRLTRDLCDAFLQHADLERVHTLTGCANASDAVVIFYHEVMWQLGERLLADEIVRLPRLFADPARAVPTDLAAVCFLTIE